MKKKMLFMAALAGAVTLGSCVKDDVSSSVEAVRNAKANELNANANLANAQAAVANAAAALATATQAAKVAQEQAQAAILQAQAQKDQADADYATGTLEQRIADQLARYAALIAANNTQVQDELNKLADKVKDADLKDYNRVKALIDQFETLYKDVIAKQNAVVKALIKLENAKYSSEAAAKVIAADVIAKKEALEKAEAVLAFIKDQGQQGKTNGQLQSEIAVLNEQLKTLTLKYQNSAELPAFVKISQELPAVWEAYQTALKNIAAQEKVVTDLGAKSPFPVKTDAKGNDVKDGAKAVWKNKYSTGTDKALGFYAYDVLGANMDTHTYFGTKNNILPGEEVGLFNVREVASAADTKKINDDLEAALDAATTTYETAVKELGTPEDVATTKVKGGTDLTLYAKLAAAKNEQEDADYEVYKVQRDYNNAAEDLAKAIADKDEAAQIAAYNKQDAAYDKLYGDFNDAKMPASEDTALKQAKYRASEASIANRPKDQLVKTAEDKAKDVEKAEEDIKKFMETVPYKDAVADLAEAEKANAAAVAVVKDAATILKAYTDATAALKAYEEKYNTAAKALMDVVDKEAEDINNQLTALKAIYTETYEKALADQEKAVAKAEKELAEAQNLADETKNPDLIIAYAEQELDKAEAALAVAQAKLDATIKAIEASGIDFSYGDDKEEEPAPAPAEDETPAEGEGEGEEA